MQGEVALQVVVVTGIVVAHPRFQSKTNRFGQLSLFMVEFQPYFL